MDKVNFGKIVVVCAVIFGLGVPIANGGLKPLIILSSSMEPVMSPGDVAVVRKTPPSKISEGDILAFEDPSGRANVLITHRVVKAMRENGELQFRTKGDAVEERDPFKVKSTDVVGKVVFQIPFLGYLFHYGKNPLAFISLIMIPAALLIFGEIRNIMKYANPVRARKAEREETKKEREVVRERTEFGLSRFAAIFIVCLVIFGVLSVPPLFSSGKNVEVEGFGSGFCPSVVFFKVNENSLPRYRIVQDNENLNIKNARVSKLSVAPYIIPPFWTGLLGRISPKLPSLLTFLLPPFIISLILYPVWRKKKKGGKPEKKRNERRGRGLFGS